MLSPMDPRDEDDDEITRLVNPPSDEVRGVAATVEGSGVGSGSMERLTLIRKLWEEMDTLVDEGPQIVSWEAETAGRRVKELAQVEKRMARDWEAIRDIVRRQSATPPIENALVLDRREADLDALQRDPKAFTVRMTPTSTPAPTPTPMPTPLTPGAEPMPEPPAGEGQDEGMAGAKRQPFGGQVSSVTAEVTGASAAPAQPVAASSTPSPVSVMDGAMPAPKRARVRVLIHGGMRIDKNCLPEPEVAPMLVLHSPGMRLTALPPPTQGNVAPPLPLSGGARAVSFCVGGGGEVAELGTWKKYGEKRIWSKAGGKREAGASGGHNREHIIKSYFRCRVTGCEARMYEEALVDTPHDVLSRYHKGTHRHGDLSEPAGRGCGAL